MLNGRPTILLVVHNGYVARFLLRTDVLPALLRADVNVVVLTPNADEPYFREEFHAPNLFLATYRLDECRAYRERSILQRTLHVIRHSSLNGRGDLSTLDYNFSVIDDETRGTGFLRRAYVQAMRGAIAIARRSPLVRRGIVTFESRAYAPDFHRDVFDRYRPDLVVTSSLGYFDFDQYVMREARRARAKIQAVILSWDNPTSWGLGGAAADEAVAWTDEMKRELVTYHDMSADRVTVCGVPHFDRYFRAPALSREALFAELGLDPRRRLIVLGSRAPTRFAWNETMVDMLGRAIEDGRFADDCQVLVRLHPIHFRRRNGRLVHEELLNTYERLGRRFPHVRFHAPEILSTKLPLDMPARDMDILAGLLRHADVMVSLLSTLNIEAAAFDRPMVNICFGGYGKDPSKVSLRENEPVVGQTFTHIKRLIGYGASVQVYNERELIDAINRYLTDPALERDARARLAAAEAGPNRGRAGEAVAAAILRAAGAELPSPPPRVEPDFAEAAAR